MGALTPARGELWWYERPDAKRRPILILARQVASERLHDLIAVPATSTVRGIETEVRLDVEDGVRRPCALTLDNTFLARKALLTERITSLGAEKMAEVCRALNAATAC